MTSPSIGRRRSQGAASRLAVGGLLVLLLLNAVAPAGALGSAPASAPPPNKFPLNVVETGLPKGLHWTVLVQGHQYTANSSTFTLQEPPGLYQVLVPQVGPYQPNQTNGLVMVGPGPGFFNVTFTKQNQTINLNNTSDDTGDTSDNNTTSGLFGLPSTEGYLVVAVLVLGVVALLSVFVITRNRRRPARRPKPSADEDDEEEGTKPPPRPKPRPGREERRRTQRRREQRESAKDGSADDDSSE